MKRVVACLSVLALLGVPAGAARADVIAVDVASFQAGADSLTLLGNVMLLNPGALNAGPQTIDLQAGIFTVGDSGPLDASFPFSLDRNVMINGVSRLVPQSGELIISPLGDTLILHDSPPVTFDHVILGGGGPTLVFPVPPPVGTVRFQVFGGSGTAFEPGEYSFMLEATTTVEKAPEPGGLTLLALGGAGLLGSAWRRRAAAKKR